MPRVIGRYPDGRPIFAIAGASEDPDEEGEEQRYDDHPREGLVRMLAPEAIELRTDEGEGGDGRTLFGHFAVFNRWTTIDSIFEGRFRERFAPGAFRKTMREMREQVRVLFQHGRDPQIGDKPIAALDHWREDAVGAYYEARLLDAGYVEEVRAGLIEKLYGASMRFSVVKDRWDHEPEPSEDNPEGLPERTVREARVPEFGPVTFPAYVDATAEVRSLSMTDDYLVSILQSDPDRLERLLASHRGGAGESHSDDGAGAGHSEERGEQDQEGRVAIARLSGPAISRDDFVASLRS